MIIQPLVHVQEMTQFKIEFQNRLPFRKLPLLFQKNLKLPQDRHKLRSQKVNIVKHLVPLSASLHFQHAFIAPFQSPLQLFLSSPDFSLHLKNLFLHHPGAVHFPRPSHQIVGFIN